MSPRWLGGAGFFLVIILSLFLFLGNSGATVDNPTLSCSPSHPLRRASQSPCHCDRLWLALTRKRKAKFYSHHDGLSSNPWEKAPPMNPPPPRGAILVGRNLQVLNVLDAKKTQLYQYGWSCLGLRNTAATFNHQIPSCSPPHPLPGDRRSPFHFQRLGLVLSRKGKPKFYSHHRDGLSSNPCEKSTSFPRGEKLAGRNLQVLNMLDAKKMQRYQNDCYSHFLGNTAETVNRHISCCSLPRLLPGDRQSPCRFQCLRLALNQKGKPKFYSHHHDGLSSNPCEKAPPTNPPPPPPPSPRGAKLAGRNLQVPNLLDAKKKQRYQYGSCSFFLGTAATITCHISCCSPPHLLPGDRQSLCHFQCLGLALSRKGKSKFYSHHHDDLSSNPCEKAPPTNPPPPLPPPQGAILAGRTLHGLLDAKKTHLYPYGWYSLLLRNTAATINHRTPSCFPHPLPGDRQNPCHFHPLRLALNRKGKRKFYSHHDGLLSNPCEKAPPTNPPPPPQRAILVGGNLHVKNVFDSKKMKWYHYFKGINIFLWGIYCTIPAIIASLSFSACGLATTPSLRTSCVTRGSKLRMP